MEPAAVNDMWKGLLAEHRFYLRGAFPPLM
jgi:hypothetical protein